MVSALLLGRSVILNEGAEADPAFANFLNAVAHVFHHVALMSRTALIAPK